METTLVNLNDVINNSTLAISKTLASGALKVSFVSKRDFSLAYKAENTGATNSETYEAFYKALKAHSTSIAGVGAQALAKGFNATSVTLNANGNRLTAVYVLPSALKEPTNAKSKIASLEAKIASLEAAAAAVA